MGESLLPLTHSPVPSPRYSNQLWSPRASWIRTLPVVRKRLGPMQSLPQTPSLRVRDRVKIAHGLSRRQREAYISNFLTQANEKLGAMASTKVRGTALW